MRLVEVHRWPLVAKAPQAAASTARSRSASGMTMRAFLDPSSSEQRLPRRAQVSATLRPTSSDPVNETAATSGCWTRAAPASSPKPWTRFSTPGGRPTSSKISTRIVASRGVSSAGLKTAVHPHTRAGAIFQRGMAMGKFHGVMRAATPAGWRRVIENLLGSSAGIVRPKNLRPSPAM